MQVEYNKMILRNTLIHLNLDKCGEAQKAAYDNKIN